MEVTERDIRKIPRGNIRVPRDEFVAQWVRAEEMCESAATVDSTIRYAAGVAVTCRWLATAIVKPPDGRPWYQAPGPVTGATCAYEELIQSEATASQTKYLVAQRDAGPETDRAREEALRGVVATFNWAWFRIRADPPLDTHGIRTRPTTPA